MLVVRVACALPCFGPGPQDPGTLLNPVFFLHVLFLFRWDHARNLSHCLILFPDSELIAQSPEML